MQEIATAAHAPQPALLVARTQNKTGKLTLAASKVAPQIAAATRIRGLRTSVVWAESGDALRVISRAPRRKRRGRAAKRPNQAEPRSGLGLIELLACRRMTITHR
jgi:hypothetical protein